VKLVLAELLSRLIVVAKNHPEIEDTEVRERMDEAVYHGFLVQTVGYQLPNSFAMYSPQGDLAVKAVLEWFLPTARGLAAKAGIDTFHMRLAAFQDLDVTVGPQSMSYNDFFGWRNPKRYAENGNVIPL
jgi:hypothetical protein